ncbi:uncharacterized protein BHQ10_010163 [Talaromyces amestolkiae]|uniref:Peptidase S8/S53 domain-containing protein n=1 Tax=Talaromyces amestolkiae TaxID=1196081 RepID=A0A364LEL3_TALAM|nr:uncharacterized protein BHQ10_010163 [Talaromyces amestolkiae]RAO74151.1 hypothetical protein BHQ10_010163 [Talaromyces amestolkiae]
MSSIGKVFDFSDARLHDLEDQGRLSDNFWQEFKTVEKCLAEYRPNSNPASHDRRVKIAVLDSGIDLNHPKIQDLILRSSRWNPDRLVSKSFVGLGESSDPVGHGTHIACTIMSIAQGAKLFVGGVVGRNKVLDSEALAEAIRFAVEEWDADIISLSLGFPKIPSKKLADLIKEALYREKLIFAAVSNGGGASIDGISWPAMATNVFGIFSCNYQGVSSPFNPCQNDDRFSRFKFLGEAVNSAWLRNGERRLTGTSVATPIAACTAALFIEYIRANMQGKGEITRAGMEAIERCARMPDGMQRIFAEVGRTTTTDAWLKHVYPWFLLKYDRRHEIIPRIDVSLAVLQLENYNEDIQILEENNAFILHSIPDQNRRLVENEHSLDIARSNIRIYVLGLMGATAFGNGTISFALPLLHWVTNVAALGTVWVLLSSARENQGRALTDYKLRATRLREEVLEAIRLNSQNLTEAERVVSELLSLVERILKRYDVSEGEMKQLEIKVDELNLHVIKEAELQCSEPVSLVVRVQSLLDELEKTINFRQEDHEDSYEKAKDTLKRGKRVVQDALDVQRELDEAKRKADAQEEKANEDFAEKERRESGNIFEWLRWFLIWLGIGGAVLVMILAAFAI